MTFLRLLLNGILLLGLTVIAGAQNNDVQPTTEATSDAPVQGSAEYVMQLLDNAIWIPDGKVASKQIYVFAAPWCPYCAELYKNSRLVGNQAQLRWIELDARDDYNEDFIGEIAKTRSSKLLLTMYGLKHVAHDDAGPFGKSADWFNTAVYFALRSLNPAWKGGYPTLMWLDAAGIYHVANRTQLTEALKTVVARPQAAEIHPIGLDMMDLQRAIPVHQQSLSVLVQKAHIYVAPSTKAPVEQDAQLGYSAKVKSIVHVGSEVWVEMDKATPVKAGENGFFFRAQDVQLRDQ